MSLGEQIRKRRIELKMSQQELAIALGYKTRSSITKIEKDKSKLTQDKLITVANILKVSIDQLVLGNDPGIIRATAGTRKGEIVDSDDFSKGTTVKEKRICSAVILGGGSKRVNRSNTPLQFVTVKEKPIIIYTMEAYQRHPLVDEIYAICLEGWNDYLIAYAEKYNITKLKGVIPAGNSGIQSVKNAVERIYADHKLFDLVIIQDAIRPFVDIETITNAILCCKKYGSAVSFESLDYLSTFWKKENGLTYIPSTELIDVQSPEVYTIGFLIKAFNDAAKINHPLSEIVCAVFLYHLGKELKYCESNANNIRIFNEESMKLMEVLV